jgi:hypothetical protein
MSERFTDLIVKCRNPEALDSVVQQLRPAVVIEGTWNGQTCKVRVFGHPGYVKFAIDRQGYGTVLSEESGGSE